MDLEKDKKYSSTSKDLVNTSLLNALFLLILSIIISFSFETWYYKFTPFILSGIYVFFDILHTKKNTFSIDFYEDEIQVKYKYINKSIHIKYTDLIEIKYLNGHGPIFNRIIFNAEGRKNKVTFLTIPYKKYVEFIKWIRNKNSETIVSVYPSDDYMTHLLQEEFGFQYAK